jgi:metal-responsive CopG/Arc/MetJ family transcriptional regulator
MSMKSSIELNDELSAEVDKAAELVGEKRATVLRLAIRAGLPIVSSRFQGPRPEGYFADAYRNWPKERQELEAASAKTPVRPPQR